MDNTKYKILDLPLEGEIHSMSGLVPYSNGVGHFRNIVMAVQGVVGPAYVPITLFGLDASNLDPDMDLRRPITCTGRLTSRQYTDRNGNLRWALSLTAHGVMLGPRPTAAPTGGTGEPSGYENEPQDDMDDIPF